MPTPHRTSSRLSKTLALGLLALLGACQPVGRLDRRRATAADHGDQESAATADGIATGWHHEGGWVIAPALEVADGATRASALVTLADAETPTPTMAAQGLLSGEPVTDWIPLTGYFEDGEARVATADFGLLVDGIALRVLESDLAGIRDLRFSGSDLSVADEEPLAEEGATREALRTELQGLGIVTREEWGASRGSCTARDGARSRISIHHTEGGATDPARQLRSVQSYHRSKGWCDVGYHFLIGNDGRVYEGRPVELLGAHVRNNNSGNLGIAFIGCFDPHECATPTVLTDAMIEAAGRLVGTLGQLYRIPISSSSVRGHRDQVSTTCPGDALYARIPDIIRVGQTSRLGEDPPAPSDPTPSEPAPSEPAPSDPTPPPASGPPAGATCTHGFGGAYANTACSESYQCCNGSWRTRGGCGACYCVEESGATGCGVGSSTPPPSGTSPGLPTAGLTQSGSEIPRAGLANATLRSAFGVSTEPYGSVESYEGASFVRGRVSWFGGPRDTGVTTTETGSISGERLRSLNDPMSPSASTLASRPADYYYAAMRWAYSPNGTSWWRNARILVVNPRTGAAVVVRPVDWGPNTSTRRVIDLSPQALADLGLSTDGEALVSFAPAGTPLGRVTR